MTIHSNRLSAAGAASRLAIIFSLLFGAAARSGAEGAKPSPGGGMHVLFIGNSLTYTNELPLIVEALARAAGEDLHVESVAYGGYSLDDQMRDGTALKVLASRRWDFVVMQHGPSSLPSSRAELRASAKKIAPLIRKAGGRPAFYMVWPEQDRSAYFDAVRESYSLAASDADGMFIPAGEAWRAALRRDPRTPLYSYDGLHPTLAGSYTAALSIYGMLYGRSPQGLPAKLKLSGGHTIEVPAPLAKALQDAATEANRKYGRP